LFWSLLDGLLMEPVVLAVRNIRSNSIA